MLSYKTCKKHNKTLRSSAFLCVAFAVLCVKKIRNHKETKMNKVLYTYLLQLGDNSMILGHRLSELCGHGPSLETDIALTNISLDLFGQVRNIFQYAAQLKGGDTTEDSIAYLRTERHYHNCILLEQPNTDFAHVICRQFLFDAYQKMELEQLTKSKDETIAAIAVKSLKETKYHLRFSSEWVKRLGDGTDLSQQKAQEAMNHLYPFVFEFFNETPHEKAMKEEQIGADVEAMKADYFTQVNGLIVEANLNVPENKPRFAQGKTGLHTEQMGFILSDFQFMQRTYPNMAW